MLNCAKNTEHYPAYESYHKILLNTLRSHERAILQYLSIYLSAGGALGWVITNSANNSIIFNVGMIGVLLLLSLGAFYTLALGYSYRYLTFQLTKVEKKLGIHEVTLAAWPKSSDDFLRRYKLGCIPWCTPPEIIWVFWIAFLVGIIGVSIIAFHMQKNLVLVVGVFCFLLVWLVLPIIYGCKLKKVLEKEPKDNKGKEKTTKLCKVLRDFFCGDGNKNKEDSENGR